MARALSEAELLQQVRESLSERRSALTAEEAAALDKFALHGGRERDACILRYLRAHRNNVALAAAGIVSTARWRLHSNIDAINPSKIMHLLSDGRMYVSRGRDKEGRPIIVNIKSSQAATDHDLSIALIVYIMEQAIKQMRNGVEKWVWIMDMKEYSSSTSPPLSVTKATIAILANHYPERLHRVYIVNAPWYFRMFWNMVTPFIDAVTRAKVVFVSIPDGPITENLFAGDIADDQLEERFGGKLPTYVFRAEDFPPNDATEEEKKDAL